MPLCVFRYQIVVHESWLVFKWIHWFVLSDTYKRMRLTDLKMHLFLSDCGFEERSLSLSAVLRERVQLNIHCPHIQYRYIVQI